MKSFTSAQRTNGPPRPEAITGNTRARFNPTNQPRYRAPGLYPAFVCAFFLWAVGLCSITRAGVQSQLQEAVASGDLRDTKVALMVIDLDTGTALAEINPDEPMSPASNMKLVTTAAAAQILGLNWIFETQLRLAQPDDWQSMRTTPDGPGLFGEKRGPVLIVQGDGDPGFCDPVLLGEHGWDFEKLVAAWAEAVHKADISKIERLIVDDRVFDRSLVHPQWPSDQLNQWYCAQVSGLNFNDNCLDIYLEPTAPGQTPKVTVLPSLPGLEMITKAVTGDTNAFWVTRENGTNKLTVWGSVKHKRSHATRVTVHDPAMVFGHVLANRLTQAGVAVGGVTRPDWTTRLPQGQVLHKVQTTMPVVLRRCNKDSQNLFAEALLKRIGHKVTGSPGSWENGAAAARFYLQEHLGAASAAVVVVDGSGLSAENRVTARVLVNLLRVIDRDAETSRVFRESLAVGGTDGTLRKRFKQDLAGRVFAKSGYIKGVSALSGYLLVPTGDGPVPGEAGEIGPHKTLAFSFLFNNIKPPVYTHKVKQVQEKMLEILDDWVGSASSGKAVMYSD